MNILNDKVSFENETLTRSKVVKSGIISLDQTFYVFRKKELQIFPITPYKNKHELMTYQTNLLHCIHKLTESYQAYSIF